MQTVFRHFVCILKVGDVEAIVAALRAHSNNAEVCEDGCRALRQLCKEDANALRIADAGDVETVIASFWGFSKVSKDSLGQAAGLHALS